MSTTSLSVLVPVKNEAANLRQCLSTVSFADDIVVVDSQSIDETATIAAGLGARVVQFQWNGKFPRKKNWALENVDWKNEWVLIIDADERITPTLQEQIKAAIHRNDVDGYYLNRRFWFLNGWINHCGYFPSWNLRLFRHRLGRYEQIDAMAGGDSGDNEVHEHVLLTGRAEYLSEPMEHFAYPTIDAFVEKHNRYSTWEARARGQLLQNPQGQTLRGGLFGNSIERKRWLNRFFARAPFRPSLRFVYHYIVKQGFRDGHRGWVLSRLLAWYEVMIAAKSIGISQAKRRADSR